MRLHNLDLNLLLILDQLHKERSVSQTAQALGVSQPAISNALKRLRAHFQDPLFQPISGRMVPTQLALQLVERIEPAIRELETIAVTRDKFAPASSNRTFRIVCSDYTFSVLMSDVIRALRRIGPGIKIECMLTTEQTPEWLRDGVADFLIVPRERLVGDHPSERLFVDDFSCVVWDGNANIGSELTMAGFLGAVHVSTMLGPARIPHLQDEAFERHRIKPRIGVYVPNFTLAAEAVVGTDLIATMHTRSAKLAVKRLPVRLLPPPIRFRPFTEMLQWHRRSSEDPGMRWMRDLMTKTAEMLEPMPAAETVAHQEGPEHGNSGA